MGEDTRDTKAVAGERDETLKTALNAAVSSRPLTVSLIIGVVDDFLVFYTTYWSTITIRQEANKKDLYLLLSRATYLKLNTFIRLKTFQTLYDLRKKYAILLQIAERSRIIYVCLACFKNYSPIDQVFTSMTASKT